MVQGMSELLKTVYASNPDDLYIIHAIEIEVANMPPILVCDGYVDRVLGGRKFEAGNITVSLPRRASAGAQKLNFGIWNAQGKAIDYVDKALESNSSALVTYYQYLDNDLDNPVMMTKKMNVKEGKFSNNTAVFEAQYHDMLNTQFPRPTYNSKSAPALQYTS